MTAHIGLWRGRPIERLSRDELLDVVAELGETQRAADRDSEEVRALLDCGPRVVPTKKRREKHK